MTGLAEGGVLAGRYRLGPVAGHGAMGEVHLAEDLRLARPVAIKSLWPELARYPEVRQRFSQEARAAARISHPNVVRVYDSGEEEGVPYLVMECLPGTSLADELEWGVLDPRRARRVGLDVLGALDAAHRLGVIHRDVKPGNILQSAVIDGPVKVSDFGIAKSAESADDDSLTDSGGLVGTAGYLAPERVAGAPAGPASDLYSLGVVLFESLAGRKPHEGDTALALALAIHMGEAPSLGELRPDLDPALVAVVDKALAHDPA
ncbi:MAG TPA: serine/threonine-protein kinase, partial [Acidimicrobiales bacterium]|nr:serine/threonine-protein kinase [Acidimicrobiales bacterium]